MHLNVTVVSFDGFFLFYGIVISRKLSILSNIVQSEARRAEESKIWQNGQIEVYRLF